MKRLLTGLAAGALLLGGCAAEVGGAAEAPATRSSSAEAPGADTSTPVGETAPPVPDEQVGLGASCSSPEGFTVGHPSDWQVNPGVVAPACSRFSPEAIDLPEASDVRLAPIVVSVQDIAFDRLTARTTSEVARSALTVDGYDALRIERITEAGLWPVGTPVTSYAIDLGNGRTLLADAVGLPGFDHDRDVAVLDAMVPTLEIA